MSQQRAKDGRKNKARDINVNSPISDVLNLAAGAVSLKKDFANCKKNMTEKHHFLVAILDGMNERKVGNQDKGTGRNRRHKNSHCSKYI